MATIIHLPRDLNRICRTCLKVANDNEPYEHKLIVNNQATELSKMLESVTTLRIDVNDCLPDALCTQCLEYLNIAYLFKNYCSNVDQDLQELIEEYNNEGNTVFISEYIDSKFSLRTIKVENNMVCNVCMKSFKTNYELNIHLIEHNKNRSLSERFQGSRVEVKYLDCHVDKSVFDLIIERKLHTLVEVQDSLAIPITNINHQKNTDSDSLESVSRSSSDIEETLVTECNTCRAFFQSEAELSSHVCAVVENNFEQTEEMTNEPVFKCPLCSKNHSNMVLLSIHFLKHAFTFDISAEIFFCETCGQIFDNKQLLEEHYQDSTCIREVWNCSICNILFETESLLLYHNNCHNFGEDTNQGKVACILCDENFFTKDNLATHTLTHLMKKYVCKECSAVFCTQQAYYQHLKFHPGYQYTCIICGQLSKTKTALKCHVIGVHSSGTSYSCDICKKSFKTPGRLKTHSHIHEEHKNFMCSYCGYTSHKAGDLQIHTRSHTSERPYKCTFAQCNMRFKTSSHLCGHLRRHLNIRNFVCSICSTSFGTRHSLKIHFMLHTGEKPHKCRTCGQGFRRKYHLKIHMRQHERQSN